MLKQNSERDINVIGSGTIIEGNFTSNGSLSIKGKIVGDVKVDGNIEIGTSGTIEGNVVGKLIKISGIVKGSINCSDVLSFHNKANVQGDIYASKLVIEEGAKFNGTCKMSEQVVLK